MNFTLNSHIQPVASGILAIALGLNGWTRCVDPTLTRTHAQQESLQSYEQSLIVLAILQAQAQGPHTVLVEYQHAKAWNKTKNWLKKNAPIIGGAGGGAIIGGLAGGGAGAVIGGAAGGGGGYLYKRLKRSHHHEYPQQNYQDAHH